MRAVESSREEVTMRENKILDIIKKRNIHNLYHFTREEHIYSILTNGLIPRAKVGTYNIEVMINDRHRYDDCEEANCLSLEFPNYKMFYSYWKPSGKDKWCVLEFDASILLDYPCVFCRENAASKEMYTLSLKERMGANALEKLFEDYEMYPQRSDTEIPDNYPTNPQAEVLVLGTIAPKYIKRIILGDLRTYKRIKKEVDDKIEVVYDEKYFKYRLDWREWQE